MPLLLSLELKLQTMKQCFVVCARYVFYYLLFLYINYLQVGYTYTMTMTTPPQHHYVSLPSTTTTTSARLHPPAPV